MPTLTILVTRRDIDLGEPGCPCKCAIARAIRRELQKRGYGIDPDVGVSVGAFVRGDPAKDGKHLEVRGITPGSDMFHLRRPIEAEEQGFIQTFDDDDTRELAEPFALTLEIPEGHSDRQRRECQEWLESQCGPDPFAGDEEVR